MPRRRGQKVISAQFFPQPAAVEATLAWRRVNVIMLAGVHKYPQRTRLCAAYTGYPIHCAQWAHRCEAGKVVQTPRRGMFVYYAALF